MENFEGVLFTARVTIFKTGVKYFSKVRDVSSLYNIEFVSFNIDDTLISFGNSVNRPTF